VFYHQLFSKSVGDDLTLSKEHVSGPSNTDATFAFTRPVNYVFNLINSDLTVNGIT